MALLDNIIAAESGGNPNARNPNSSATGLGQFIDSTWLDVLNRHRPDLTTGKSRQELLDLRSDPALSREMTGAYAADNAGVLASAGIQPSPGAVYLAHFAGPQGAVKILGADPNTPVAALLGNQAVKANPFLKDMSAADLQKWASGKAGGIPLSQPVQAGVAGATSSPSQGMAADQMTQNTSIPQATPQQVQQQPDYFSMLQPSQLQDLPNLRRKIDLTKIQAMLHPAPSRVFY